MQPAITRMEERAAAAKVRQRCCWTSEAQALLHLPSVGTPTALPQEVAEIDFSDITQRRGEGQAE